MISTPHSDTNCTTEECCHLLLNKYIVHFLWRVLDWIIGSTWFLLMRCYSLLKQKREQEVCAFTVTTVYRALNKTKGKGYPSMYDICKALNPSSWQVDTVWIGSVDTVWIGSVDTVWIGSVDTVWIGSVDTVWIGSVDTVWIGSVDTAWIGSVDTVWIGSVDTVWIGSVDTVWIRSVGTVWMGQLIQCG